MKKYLKFLFKKIEKVIKTKERSYVLNGEAMIILLIVALIKTTLFKMSQYFPKAYRNFGGNVEIELYLSSYDIKTDLTLPGMEVLEGLQCLTF